MAPRRLKRPRQQQQQSLPLPVVSVDGEEGEPRVGLTVAGGVEEEGQGSREWVWETREGLRARQRARVGEVMAEMGLVKAADTVIGAWRGGDTYVCG